MCSWMRESVDKARSMGRCYHSPKNCRWVQKNAMCDSPQDAGHAMSPKPYNAGVVALFIVMLEQHG